MVPILNQAPQFTSPIIISPYLSQSARLRCDSSSPSYRLPHACRRLSVRPVNPWSTHAATLATSKRLVATSSSLRKRTAVRRLLLVVLDRLRRQCLENVLFSGFITNVTTGLHGWHIHEFGITPGDNPCGSAGGHFNPLGKSPGKYN